MDRVLLVARNAFRGVMSRKVIYIWGAAILLMFLRSSPAVFMRNDNEAVMAFIRTNAITGAMGLWAWLCIAAAVFLGAGAIPSEITTRTIVTVLARPIRRWEMLLGKWLGLSAFCVVTLAIGIGLALILARYLGIDVNWKPLGASAMSTVAAITLYGGVALVLSTSGSAGLAGALTVLLVFMPQLINVLVDDPGPVRHRTGMVLDYLVPPAYEGSYETTVAWVPPPFLAGGRGSRQPPVPRVAPVPPVMDYEAERSRSGQDIAYAGVYFLIGCVLFTRRDIKLG